MKPHLGYYVHHHGRGHVSRAAAVLRELEIPATVLTSSDVPDEAFPGADVVRLPLDTEQTETVEDLPLPTHLHYAPPGVPGLRQRMADLAGFLADTAPALLVVDVSVEVAQLARLTGTPVVVMRQHGRRWDLAHMAAYDAAVGLLGPFSAKLEEPDAPEMVRKKTFYAGGFVDAPQPLPTRNEARGRLGRDEDEPVVVVTSSSGGNGPEPEGIAAAAAATDHTWIVIGRSDVDGSAVSSVGWVDDPIVHLAAADVVVGSAGHNTVMEVAAAARPFVCVPETRPFDEQVRKAERLRELDLAEVVSRWPPPGEWQSLLTRARERGGDGLSELVDGHSAVRAARWLESWVQRYAS